MQMPMYHIMLPISVDITIITSENVNELTDIKVARWPDGIMSFRMTSVRTSKKSSTNEPTPPPTIMTYGFPVNTMQNANKTPRPLNRMNFRYLNFGKYSTIFAPNAEPFYRVDNSRNGTTGGTGLGLYIVRGILENHNAEYGINNTEDGVCFWLRLPKKQ